MDRGKLPALSVGAFGGRCLWWLGWALAWVGAWLWAAVGFVAGPLVGRAFVRGEGVLL